MKVLAAVVTHNRKALLERCIGHLRAQVRQPEAVVVIDNGSTDGTAERMAELGVRVIRQDNVGSAGGWHRCIDTALAEGFDAVWMMDDDGYPDAAALSYLEPALTPETALVSSLVVREDNPQRLVFPMTNPADGAGGTILSVLRRTTDRRKAIALSKDRLLPLAHLFNGALVNLAAVKAVGNVERDFFIYGEEVDYWYRLGRFGPIRTHVDALHFHPDVSHRKVNDVKLYYWLRNALIIDRRHRDGSGARRALLVATNVLLNYARRNGLADTFSLLLGKRRGVLSAAMSKGLDGKLGRDFPF
jgi:rhamnopyranosyl-N-acetylglucosaminyl-diphospho-decaprenol beta-1,3/1,4-galactofuranosyltransferase